MRLQHKLWMALRHGDFQHQVWLKAAIDAFFEGQEPPPPQGSSTKEAFVRDFLAYIDCSDLDDLDFGRGLQGSGLIERARGIANHGSQQQ